MKPVLMILLQAASAAPQVTTECDGDSSGEIVVCGTRPGRSRYRLPILPKTYESKLPKAEMEIAPGLKAAVKVDSVELPGGAKSDRVMIQIGTKL
ncbi:hypothetical protein H8M03_03735 [Sphingomonas sabuli]|uniref:Uncharacterized protein n=1 Tax=Sphingomonas sabuli TaxID=2764186 RepID=A0A7G9L4A8_9SPHN|nr:hypothetical protein [Sphingomonas sabuli]QNM83457.1 hypothetical protein H8M03_03735 [Sphingomonas sabuli]